MTSPVRPTRSISRALFACLAGLPASSAPAQDAGPITFGPPQRILVGEDPRAVAAADLDGDGLVDLVAANYERRDLSVVRNRGTFGFEGEQPVAVRLDARGARPLGVRTSDVNGDGRPDIAVVTETDRDDPESLSLLVATRRGAYALTEYNTREPRFTGLDFVDLDADGDPDLLLTPPPGEGAAWLHLNVGGRFVPPRRPWAIEAGDTRGPLPAYAFADIDGDGAIDCLAPGADGTLLTWRGPFRGTTSTKGEPAAAGLPPGIQRLGTLVSVVVASAPNSAEDPNPAPVILVLRQPRGEAPFRLATLQPSLRGAAASPIAGLPAMRSIEAVRLVDLDADGFADLAVLGRAEGSGADQLIVCKATPDGGFGKPFAMGLPIVNPGAAFADLDNDGKPELVIPDYERTLLVYPNTSTGDTSGGGGSGGGAGAGDGEAGGEADGKDDGSDEGTETPADTPAEGPGGDASDAPTPGTPTDEPPAETPTDEPSEDDDAGGEATNPPPSDDAPAADDSGEAENDPTDEPPEEPTDERNEPGGEPSAEDDADPADEPAAGPGNDPDSPDDGETGEPPAKPRNPFTPDEENQPRGSDSPPTPNEEPEPESPEPESPEPESPEPESPEPGASEPENPQNPFTPREEPQPDRPVDPPPPNDEPERDTPPNPPPPNDEPERDTPPNPPPPEDEGERGRPPNPPPPEEDRDPNAPPNPFAPSEDDTEESEPDVPRNPFDPVQGAVPRPRRLPIRPWWR